MAAHAKDVPGHRIVPAIPLAFGSKPKSKQAQPPKSAAKTEFNVSHQSEAENIGSVNAHAADRPGTPVAVNGILTPTSNASELPDEKILSNSDKLDLQAAPDGPVEGAILREATPELEPLAPSNLDTTPPAVTNKAVRELPPPFYPAQPQSNTSSVASTSNRLDPPVPQATLHHARYSANGLVFGGYRDSNSSSPAHPLPVGAPPHLLTSGPPVSAFVPPQSFMPAGHSYHYSETQASQPYPQPMGPPPSAYGYLKENSSYMSPPHFVQPRQYYSPNGRFRQPGLRQDEYAIGPRYGPQVIPYYPHPQHVRYSDPNFTRHPIADPRRVYEQDGASGEPTKKANDVSRRQSVVSSNEDINSYLQHQFGNAEFADCALELSHSDHLFSPITLPVHGVLLARSPKLRSLMAMQHGNPTSFPKPLIIVVSDKFMTRDDAFVTALKRLYGEQLLDQDSGPRAVLDSMRLALAYAAAGHFLQVDEIITRGLDLATRLLSWESVEMALAFALDGGLSFSWNSIEISDDKGSSSSFDDTKMDSPASAPTYGIYSERLLNSAVQFLINNIPSSFKFTPSMLNSGKSRFSQIRFGEMTIEDQPSAPSNSAMITISGILVSLPFPILKHILENHTTNERLGAAVVAETMQAAVEEREQRRRANFKPRGTPPVPSVFEDRLLHNSRWVEKVEQSELASSGFVLTRHRSTADTPPPSSDSAKS